MASMSPGKGPGKGPSKGSEKGGQHGAAEARRPDPSRVLATALVRAADDLGVTQKRVAKMLGISPASASRILQGRAIEPETKEGELALLFLRLYRSLDALLGGGRANMRAWLHAPNHDLGGTPVELVQSVTGLVRVVDYLDAMRGRV